MTRALGERARQVLSRFPGHLDVERPGKQIALVVEGLAADFDAFASQIAGVRNAHRLGFAPTIRDLLQLAALHGVSDADLSLVTVRTERLRQLIAQLQAAGPADGAAIGAAATPLLDAFGIDGADERLAAFAPADRDGVAPDLAAAAQGLLRGALVHVGFEAAREAIRRRVEDTCLLHAGGNGTVRATLLATLSALDLEVERERNADVLGRLVAEHRTSTLDLEIRDEFFHSASHFWHSTFVTDSEPLTVEIAVALPHADVLMGATIALAVLAQRADLPVARVIDRAQVTGRQEATFDTRVSFDEADAIGAAEGFTVERVPRGTLELRGGLAVTTLAVKLGITPERVRSDLAALAGAAVTPDAELTPQQCAVVARKFGYRVNLQPGHGLEALGIEENPLRREQPAPVLCAHGQLFTVRRRGFGHQTLRAVIKGVEDLTMSPMLVNRDEGRGVGFFGTVPEGSSLMITEEGRVFLDGDDATGQAYSWAGACFAEATPHARDFVFDGPGVTPRYRTRFVDTLPAGGLDRETVYPHAPESLEAPGINVGETRFALFVQQAHTGHRAPAGSGFGDLTATPRHVIAFANQSVFAGGDDQRNPDGPDPLDPVAAEVVLSWLEHEGYAVRVIIPSRFRYLSGDDHSMETRLLQALERIRPAGVQFRVEFADDRWTLGTGTLTDEEPLDDNPNDLLRGGTVLWPPDDDL